MNSSLKYITIFISDILLLTCPKWYVTFKICTNPSDYQFGSVTVQDDQHLSSYSRKLTTSHWERTVGERALLSLVEENLGTYALRHDTTNLQ